MNLRHWSSLAQTSALLLCVLGLRLWAEPVFVLVELKEAPAAVIYEAVVKAQKSAWLVRDGTRDQLRRVEAEQSRVLSRLQAEKSADTAVLYRVQRTFNGIALRCEASFIPRLAAMPEVERIHRPALLRLDTTSSVPFIGAQAVWDALGLTGQGVSVAVIDSGIDYLHPTFGLANGPAYFPMNDPRAVGDVPFPTEKIVGGYDFVGDDYDVFTPGRNVPVPDPDPMDQMGHGTHVAGILAGYGVRNSGEPYMGPWNATTSMGTLAVGPGVAPEAKLHALKIFGRAGASLVFLPAVDYVVDPDGDGDFSDHVDVLNLSLGDDFGASDSPESVAVDRAAAVGVIVVAAAGNAYDTYFSVGSPASGRRVIAVAASEDRDPNDPSLSPDRLARYSSRGPAATGDGTASVLLKPDVCAPGSNIRSAAATNLNIGLVRTLSGTSMATPHTAGLMALLRQAHPAWSVAELKALVMNYALYDVFFAANYGEPRTSPQRAGAGRIAADLTVRGPVLLYDAEDPEAVSVTFRTNEVMQETWESRLLRIVNRSDTAVRLTPTLAPQAVLSGVTVRLGNAEEFTLGAGEETTVALNLSATPSLMQHMKDPSALGGFSTLTRYWVSEVSGKVVLKDAAAQPVARLPYYACLRPASRLHAERSRIDAPENSTISLTLVGQGLDTGGADPFRCRALTSAFECMAVSPDEPTSQGIENSADLAFVGITTDYVPGMRVEDATLYIALAVHGPWYSPHYPLFYVFVETTGDDRADFLVSNEAVRSGTGNEGSYPDVFASVLSDFKGGRVVQGYINRFGAQELNTEVFRSRVMFLPVRAASLGLSEENAALGIRVETALRTESAIPSLQRTLDVVPAPRRFMRWNLMRPGIRFAYGSPGAPLFYAEAGAALTFEADAERIKEYGTLGVLLLHHLNPLGEQADWVQLRTDGDSDGNGISDVEEPDGDLDGDGIPDYLDPDDDGDGMSDVQEGTHDTDGDGVPDYRDTDSDNDGLSDREEFIAGTNPYDADSDGDGIPDGIEGLDDPDRDRIPNALDTDSDNDGIGDALEGVGDPDGDGVPNFLDDDSDGDSIPDSVETSLDADTDGAPNFVDLDSDNDGLWDRDEYHARTDPYGTDSDADGIPDSIEGLRDADGDGLVNALDFDSDGDTLRDEYEGIADPDGDGIPNFLDLDSDNDEISDADESLRYQTNPYDTDTDGDGYSDASEIAQGQDPRVPDPPSAPEGVHASDGVFPDRVEVTWLPVRGKDVTYQVWRKRVGIEESYIAVSDWIGETMFEDTSAEPSTRRYRFDCSGGGKRYTVYRYIVKARHRGGESPFSEGDTGYRK